MLAERGSDSGVLPSSLLETMILTFTAWRVRKCLLQLGQEVWSGKSYTGRTELLFDRRGIDFVTSFVSDKLTGFSFHITLYHLNVPTLSVSSEFLFFSYFGLSLQIRGFP